MKAQPPTPFPSPSPSPSPFPPPPTPTPIPIGTVDRSIFSFISAGSTLVAPIVREWIFSYTILQPKILPVYEGGGSGAGIRRVYENSVDFGFSERAPSEDQEDRVLTYPYLGSSVLVVYNVPEIKEHLDSRDFGEVPEISPDNYLILGRETLARIFSGEILYWNDTAILEDNTPGLAEVNDGALFPHRAILKVVRSESSGTTTVFTQALSSFDEEFAEDIGVRSTFPDDLTDRVDFIEAIGSSGVVNRLRDLEGSIGYSSFASNFETQNLYALVPNIYGELASPDPSNPASQTLFSDLEYDDNFQSSAVDLNITGIYPIIGLAYLLVNPEVNVDCVPRSFAFRYLRYTLLPSSSIRFLGLSNSYILLDNNIASQVLNDLEKITCEGESVLAITVLDNHDSGFFPAILALSMASIIILIGSGIYYVATIPGVRKTSMIRFTICLLLGGFLCLIANIFFYLVPDETWICQLRLWITASGLTLMVTALAARNWNLLQIFLRRKDFFTYETSERDINILMVIIFTLQMGLLIAWTAADLYEASLRTEDDLNREFTWECTSDNETLWFALEIALFAVIILFMIVTVYFVWKFSADIVGHKYTVMSIYNLIMVFTIMIVIFATTIDDDEGVAIAAMCSLLVVVWSTIFLNFHVTLLTMGSVSGSSSKTSKN